MTNTEPERRYFQHIFDRYVSAAAPEYVANYVASPNYREVLITPIPTIEVGEPDEYGDRWIQVGDRFVGRLSADGTPDMWRNIRDARQRSAGEAEAAARWIEAHPEPDPESVARIKAVRDALAALTDDERAEALR